MTDRLDQLQLESLRRLGLAIRELMDLGVVTVMRAPLLENRNQAIELEIAARFDDQPLRTLLEEIAP